MSEQNADDKNAKVDALAVEFAHLCRRFMHTELTNSGDLVSNHQLLEVFSLIRAASGVFMGRQLAMFKSLLPEIDVDQEIDHLATQARINFDLFDSNNKDVKKPTQIIPLHDRVGVEK